MVMKKIPLQLFISLQLGFRFMKIVQGFISFLGGAEGTFHFTFRTNDHLFTILPSGQMRLPVTA